MKRTFIIASAIAFGVTTALVLISIILLATGVMKRSIFGGYSFSFESSASDKTLEQIQKKEDLIAGLKFEDVQIVPAEYGHAVIAVVTNPANDDIKELISMNLLFYKDGKVVKVLSPVENVNIKAGERKKFMTDILEKGIPEFDKCELLTKN